MSESELSRYFVLAQAQILPFGVVWVLRFVWGMKPVSEVQCGMQLVAEKVLMRGSETGKGPMME